MGTLSHGFDLTGGANSQTAYRSAFSDLRLAKNLPSSDSRTIDVTYQRDGAGNNVCVDEFNFAGTARKTSQECSSGATYVSFSYDPVAEGLLPDYDGLADPGPDDCMTVTVTDAVKGDVGSHSNCDTFFGFSGSVDYYSDYNFYSSGTWDSAVHSWGNDCYYQTLDVTTTLDDGSLTLTVSNEAGDSVQVSPTGGSESFDISALATSSSVSISASFDGGSDLSTTATISSVTVSGEEILAPANLTATSQGTDQIDLSWDAVDNATEYRVYRATASGSTTGDYTQVATVSDPTTSYSDTGAADSETHYYRVTAYNGTDGESGVSNESSATTDVPAPTNLSVTVSGRAFDLSWTDNAGNEDGYRVYLSNDGGATWTQDNGDLAANTTSYTTTDQLDGTTYDIEVRAFSTDAGESTPTTAQATTALPDVAQPTLGNGVEDELAISWTDVINNGSYRIQVRETGAASWTNTASGWDEQVVGEATTSVTSVGREDGEEYEVRMRTETADATGAWTVPVSIVTKFPGATNLSVDAVGDTTLDISWTDNADNEDGFRVYVAEELDELADTGMGAFSVAQDLAPNTTSTTLTGLSPNHDYDVYVEAYTEHTAAQSATVTETTSFTPPSQGWFVTFTDDAGDVARLTGDRLHGVPVLQPEKSAVGKWKLDIRPLRDLREWLRTEARIYLNGTVIYRGPFHTYRLNGGRGPADRLEGFDVVDKLRHGGDVYQVQSEYGHDALESYLDNNTPFTANVTPPTTTTVDNDLLVQDTPDDLSFADLFGTPSNTDAWVKNGTGASATIEPLQRCFLMEGESATGSYGTFNDSAFSDGQAANLDTAGQYAEWTFTLDYDIPADEFGVFLRIQGTNNSSQIRWLLDGTELANVGVSTNGNVEFYTLHESGAWSDPGQVSAGTYTLRAEVSIEDTENFNIDAVAPCDTRASYTLPSSLTNGRLDAPRDYPGVTIEGSAFDSTFNITEAQLSVTVDNPGGAATLQAQNDGTNWYPTDGTEADTASVTADFAAQNSLGTDAKGRIELDGYGTRDTAIPRTGYQPTTLSEWHLRIDTNSIRVIDDQTYTGSPFDIATAIAQDSGMVFVPDYDAGSLTLEAFAPGEVTKTVDWNVVDVPEPVDTVDGYANSVTVFGPEDGQGGREQVTATSQSAVAEHGEIEAPALFRPDATSTAELESIARTELSKRLAKDTVTGKLKIESQFVQPGYAYEVPAFEAIDSESNPVYTLEDGRFAWGEMTLDFESQNSLARALGSITTEVQTTKRAV